MGNYFLDESDFSHTQHVCAPQYNIKIDLKISFSVGYLYTFTVVVAVGFILNNSERPLLVNSSVQSFNLFGHVPQSWKYVNSPKQFIYSEIEFRADMREYENGHLYKSTGISDYNRTDQLIHD